VASRRSAAFAQLVRGPIELLVCCLALGLPSSAGAFHRQTPPLTVLTTSGDTDLPRLPSQGRRVLALAHDQGIVMLWPFSTQAEATPLAASGGDPAVSVTGKAIAWEESDDPLGLGLPGSQIVLWQRNQPPSVPWTDPSGTSANPSLDKRGTLVFESAGDLTHLGTPGVNRVYALFRNGTLSLVSSGSGWSGHAMLGTKLWLVAFESTSDPLTGGDTGTKQIWVGHVDNLPAAPVTSGAGPSTDPIVSNDSRLIAFVSVADLAGSGADTGVPQVFIYDTRTQTFARITNEPAPGCSRPGVAKDLGDYRVTFVCDGQAYYHNVRENQRYYVPTPGGSTQSIIPGMGAHFLTISTTADLAAGSGTTAGHQIYLLNLYKAPVPVAAGSAVWFPWQGIPGR
jgi:hypothetical protein